MGPRAASTAAGEGSEGPSNTRRVWMNSDLLLSDSGRSIDLGGGGRERDRVSVGEANRP